MLPKSDTFTSPGHKTCNRFAWQMLVQEINSSGFVVTIYYYLTLIELH